jgi:hypothetical protein
VTSCPSSIGSSTTFQDYACPSAPNPGTRQIAFRTTQSPLCIKASLPQPPNHCAQEMTPFDVPFEQYAEPCGLMAGSMTSLPYLKGPPLLRSHYHSLLRSDRVSIVIMMSGCKVEGAGLHRRYTSPSSRKLPCPRCCGCSTTIPRRRWWRAGRRRGRRGRVSCCWSWVARCRYSAVLRVYYRYIYLPPCCISLKRASGW